MHIKPLIYNPFAKALLLEFNISLDSHFKSTHYN